MGVAKSGDHRLPESCGVGRKDKLREDLGDFGTNLEREVNLFPWSFLLLFGIKVECFSDAGKNFLGYLPGTFTKDININTVQLESNTGKHCLVILIEPCPH